MINNIISCEFNIDTACVEVKLTDGSMVVVIKESTILNYLFIKSVVIVKVAFAWCLQVWK